MPDTQARSVRNLERVHKDLVKVYQAAYDKAEVKPVVTEGARTLERQKQLVAAGASRTLNSRHIPGKDGTAKAIDVAFFINGKVRWDWPLYKTFADVMKAEAKRLGIPIEWGGDWRSFKDGPHFQLPYGVYP
jgi:peptidoglycan L-alanyl-D-glutamate endopeptidase CwlK